MAHESTKTTEIACKADSMDPVHAKTNSTNISVTRITESIHHTFIVGIT